MNPVGVALIGAGPWGLTLGRAISRLPEIQQTVLGMYYYDDLRLREISKIMGMHESLVTRIRWQAILKLRTCMAKLWPTVGGRYCSN